ncbi:uncharacterized protein TNCV_3902381 [Trichonephila clavipes]|nr:uncharacterized protein TNCV_3902381 [Trichonephila clavipes]
MCDHTWYAMFESFSLPVRLNCFLGLFVLPIDRQSKTCGLCLHNDWPGILTPSAASTDQLWYFVEAVSIAVPQGYIQSLFAFMPRRVEVVIANNGVHTNC